MNMMMKETISSAGAMQYIVLGLDKMRSNVRRNLVHLGCAAVSIAGLVWYWLRIMRTAYEIQLAVRVSIRVAGARIETKHSLTTLVAVAGQ